MSSRSKSDLNLGKAGRSRRGNADSNMRASRQRSSSPPTRAEAARYRSRSPPRKCLSRASSATVNTPPDKSKPAPRKESEDISLDTTSSSITQSSVCYSSGTFQEKAARAKFTQSISSTSFTATSMTPSIDPRQRSGSSQRYQNNGSFPSNVPPTGPWRFAGNWHKHQASRSFQENVSPTGPRRSNSTTPPTSRSSNDIVQGTGSRHHPCAFPTNILSTGITPRGYSHSSHGSKFSTNRPAQPMPSSQPERSQQTVRPASSSSQPLTPEPLSDPLSTLARSVMRQKQEQITPVSQPSASIVSQDAQSGLGNKRYAVILTNIPYTIRIWDVKDFMEQLSILDYVNVRFNSTRMGKVRRGGIVHVDFDSQAEAQFAVARLQKHNLKGRQIFARLSTEPAPPGRIEPPYENLTVIAYGDSYPIMTNQVATEFRARGGTMIDDWKHVHYNPNHVVDKDAIVAWGVEFEFETALEAKRVKNRFEGCLVQGKPLIVRYKFVDNTKAKLEKARKAAEEAKYASESIKPPKPVCLDWVWGKKFTWNEDHTQCCPERKPSESVFLRNIHQHTGAAIIKEELEKQGVVDYKIFKFLPSHPQHHKEEKLVYLQFETVGDAKTAVKALETAQVRGRCLSPIFGHRFILPANQADDTKTIEVVAPRKHIQAVEEDIESRGGKLVPQLRQIDNLEYPVEWISQGHTKDHVDWAKSFFEFKTTVLARRALNRLTPWAVGDPSEPLQVVLKFSVDISVEEKHKVKKAIESQEEECKEEIKRAKDRPTSSRVDPDPEQEGPFVYTLQDLYNSV